MTQGDSTPVWRRNEPDSPCVQICMQHPEARICIGCHRTGDEIARWPSMTPEERAEVRAQLPDRGKTLTQRRRTTRRKGSTDS